MAVELHCWDAGLALKLGCEPVRSAQHLAQIREGEAVIMVRPRAHVWPLIWRWQLDRDDRDTALRNSRRGR